MIRPTPDMSLERLSKGAGNAPVALALHSLGLSGRSWQSVADCAGANLFTYDQRGHGAEAAFLPGGCDALVADAQTMLDRVPHLHRQARVGEDL